MVKKFGKRRGEVASVYISGGNVFCTIEDKDIPNREYNAKLTTTSISETSIPPVGTEVLVEKIGGEVFVTNIVSSSVESGLSESEVKEGAVNQCASMSFVFAQRDGASDPEKLSIEYRDGGYVIDLDVDGDITIDAGGDVTIKEGGTAKKVLTEDAVFEYEDTDENGSTATKTTSKVSNGEKTSVEIE